MEDFFSGPVVRTLPFNAGNADLIPGWEAKIPYALWQKKKKNQNTKEKQCCNKFNKDFLNGPLLKKKKKSLKNKKKRKCERSICLKSSYHLMQPNTSTNWIR